MDVNAAHRKMLESQRNNGREFDHAGESREIRTSQKQVRMSFLHQLAAKRVEIKAF
jgi:hypothetical protein